MKIGIDASRAFVGERTGIEEYSYRVIKYLRKELQNDEVFLYIRKGQKIDFKLPQNWKIKVINFPYLWTQVGLSLEMLIHPVDALFIPAHVVPIIHSKNTFVTVHGLEFEMFPEGYSFWARFYMRWSIRFSCRWAKKIIAVSQNTRNDLMKLYKIPEEKIEVIYEGISENLKFEILNFKSNLNNKILNYKPYILFVGRLEKRKNIEGIIETYKILKEKYNMPHKLVLAGKSGFGYNDLKLKINNLFKISNLKFQIIETGFVTEEEKYKLLKNADLFLFPTFYEGFGLPILEAQVAGVPVICSNVSSLPEIGGDSVVYCNLKDTRSIAEAVYSLISNQDLKNDIIKKGYENIKKFSWEDCSFQVSKILTNGDK